MRDGSSPQEGQSDDDDPESVLSASSHAETDDDDQEKVTTQQGSTLGSPKVTYRALFTLFILVYINLLNYMDRYTISSVLIGIKEWFNIGNSAAGLLQTAFVCSYMVFAPLFGYLGDRYSRKIVMAFGISIWAATTFSGSLMGKTEFIWFLVFRGLVGIGEASYSTVAPTIIADLFVGSQRTKALTLFYFAIPCGSGLGYIAGAKVAALMGNHWQWALRVTPVLGVVAVLLTLFVAHEPQRGAVECKQASATDLCEFSESATLVLQNTQTFLQDVKAILRVPSFIWSTLAFLCLSFAVGAFAFWAPTYTYVARLAYDKSQAGTLDQVSGIFGIITFVSGVIGVFIGAEWARRWKRVNMKADALVCAFGILLAIPFLFFALWCTHKYVSLSWVLLCLGEILMCFNWVPNGDMLLYVIPPSCRSTAEAVQILIIHAFGDAFSPLLIGAVSDLYVKGSTDDVVKYLGLLYALFIPLFLLCIAAMCYLITGFYLIKDKETVDGIVEMNSKSCRSANKSATRNNENATLGRENQSYDV